jgi:hypothetical protein
MRLKIGRGPSRISFSAVNWIISKWSNVWGAQTLYWCHLAMTRGLLLRSTHLEPEKYSSSARQLASLSIWSTENRALFCATTDRATFARPCVVFLNRGHAGQKPEPRRENCMRRISRESGLRNVCFLRWTWERVAEEGLRNEFMGPGHSFAAHG